jgi:hypothetical protein
MTAIEVLRAELAKAQRMVTALEQALAVLDGGDEPPAPAPPARRSRARAAAAPAVADGGGAACKVCKVCGETRPEEFYASSGARCKACAKKASRDSRDRRAAERQAPVLDAPSTDLPPARPPQDFDRLALIRERQRARENDA